MNTNPLLCVWHVRLMCTGLISPTTHTLPNSPRFARVTITDQLLNQLLPGPVTLIFQRRDALPQTVNEASSSVGVRVPDARFVRALCERVDGGAIALTSANRSGEPSALETSVSG